MKRVIPWLDFYFDTTLIDKHGNHHHHRFKASYIIIFSYKVFHAVVFFPLKNIGQDSSNGYGFNENQSK